MTPTLVPVTAEQVTATVIELRKTGKASVNDIAAHHGLSRSTAHRRLREAVEQGLLRVAPGHGGYVEAR